MNPVTEIIILSVLITGSVLFLSFFFWRRLTQKGDCTTCHTTTPHCQGCDLPKDEPKKKG